MITREAAQPLAGIRVVEIASFVAVPLAGMTLASLGAEVIRVDPIGGAADYHRWPVTDDGTSIYWAGLNRGKRSVAADLRNSEGQELVARLITERGPGGGILITNVVGREWHSPESLSAARPDLIHLEVLGRADGSTGVDYTVNAATGFPHGHRACRTHRAGEPRVTDLGCGVWALRRAVDHRSVTAPRNDWPRQPHPTAPGRRRAGHRGKPWLPDRGDGEPDVKRENGQLDLWPVRSGLSPAATECRSWW